MRFSLTTLLLIVTVVALTLVTVNQLKLSRRVHQQTNRIHDLSSRLDEFEGYGKIQERISAFLGTLDLDNKSDLEAYRLVRQCMPKVPSKDPVSGQISVDDRWSAPTQQLIDVYPDETYTQVLSLKHRNTGGGTYSKLSSNYSVNVLFHGIHVVDVLILGVDVEFLDFDNDGGVDLLVHEQIMFDEEIVRYAITPSGFARVAEDETYK